MMAQEEFSRTNYPSSLTKSVDSGVNYRSSKSKRSVEWDDENLHQNEGKFQTKRVRCRANRRVIMAMKERHAILLLSPYRPF